MTGLTIQQKEKEMIMALMRLKQKIILVDELNEAIIDDGNGPTIIQPEIEKFLNDLSADGALLFFPELGEIKNLSFNKLSGRLADLKENY